MDLSDLTAVTTAQGPFATVCLETSRTTEDGAAQVELRWRGLRQQLVEASLDELTLAALDDAATDDREVSGEHGRYLVAAGGRLLLAEELPFRPRSEIATVSAVPHLMPLVVQRMDLVPFVRVLADRVGADVLSHGPGGDREVSQDGDTQYIHKVTSGGWAQRRFSDTTEDVWKKNAKGVAEVVDREVDRVGARLVLAAGDGDALTALETQLSARSLELLLRVPEGSRADGADITQFEERTAEQVAAIAAADVMQTVDRYRTEQGQGGRSGRAAEGLAMVLDAVRQQRVDTLLLHDDPSSDLQLLGCDDPTLVAESERELEQVGATGVFTARADALLVRALAASGAEIVVVPHAELALADGVGALLRWSDDPTRPDTT